MLSVHEKFQNSKKDLLTYMTRMHICKVVK